MVKVENAKFSWLLHVEDKKIAFNGREAAMYFAKHYAKLGDEVEIVNDNYLLRDIVDTTDIIRITHNNKQYSLMISNGKILEYNFTKGNWGPTDLTTADVIRHVV